MRLSWTKVLDGVFGKKEVKIALVGLDGVGKTSILYKLKLGQIVSTTHTIDFNVETLEYNNISFIIMDFPGQYMYKLRPLWRHYFHNIQGLIYVVDSTDRDSVDETRDYLHEVLNRNELRDAMVLVLANKQDLPNAMNADEITQKLELHTLSQPRWHIQNTCATTGEGLQEGLDWLYNIIVNKDEGSSS